MGDRKRRGLAPSLEPVERRDLLSGLLVALQANVPHLSAAQVAGIATNLSRSAAAGTVSADAGAGGSGGGGGGGGSGGGSGGATGGNTSAKNDLLNGVYQGNGSSDNVINNVPTPIGPNAAASFPNSPILGTGTPTAAELAREKFVAKFSGPLSVLPGRFSDQKQIIYLRGLGGSTPNFFLHADYSLAIVIPTDRTQLTTGFAFLDDKNNNSGGVVGLDLVATAFDAKGRPTQLTFTADPNVYGGIFFVDSAAGVVDITYHKNTATTVFNGRIYTSGLTSPFQNVDLYKRGGRLTNRG